MYVSVIIPTHNRRELLEACLGSFSNQSYPGDSYEVIVVDDNPGDDTPSFLRDYAKEAPYLFFLYFSQDNAGMGAAYNPGAENSSGDILLFTNDDCVTERNLIKNIIDCYSPEDVACAGGKTAPSKCADHIRDLFRPQKDSITGCIHPLRTCGNCMHIP